MRTKFPSLIIRKRFDWIHLQLTKQTFVNICGQWYICLHKLMMFKNCYYHCSHLLSFTIIYMAWFSFMWHLAQMKLHSLFKDPIKITQKLVFPYSFYIFLLIFRCKLQKIWFSGLRSYLGCVPYAQSWVFFLKCSKYSFFVALLLSW